MNPYTAKEILEAFPPPVYVVGKNDPPPASEDALVPEGRRNAYLTRVAGVFVRQGIRGSDLEQHLLLVNQNQLEAPLPETEVQQILKSAGGWKSPGLSEPTLTEWDAYRMVKTIWGRPEYVLHTYLPRGQVCLLGGHGGVGKSYVALTIAVDVAAGLEFAAEFPTEQGRVLYVNLEDDLRVVSSRLRYICEARGLEPKELAGKLTILDGTSKFAALMTLSGEGSNANTVFTAAYQELSEYAAGYDLIIIDNASDAFDANENSRRHVRQFIQALAKIARDHNAAVLLLAHIDKNAAKGDGRGNNYSGSTAWHNSCRSRWALLRDNDGSVTLVHEKNNLGKLGPPLIVTTGAKGVPSFAAPEQESESDDLEDLITAFRAAEKANVIIPTKLDPGAYSATSRLETVPDYPKRFATRTGRKVVIRLINRMKAEYALKEVEYKTDQRKTKTCLKLAENAETIMAVGAELEEVPFQ